MSWYKKSLIKFNSYHHHHQQQQQQQQTTTNNNIVTGLCYDSEIGKKVLIK